MNAKNKIMKPIILRFAVWGVITIILLGVCFSYHSNSETRFSPIISVALVIILSYIMLNSLGLVAYLLNKGFAGEIVEMNVISKRYMRSALDKSVEKRTFVIMTIKCDNGKTIKFEEMLPKHLTRIIPYRKGDRVLHIKGAPHLCRFPRNDTETKYDPISVICPICGACLPLGSKECSFCETELPWDPDNKPCRQLKS